MRKILLVGVRALSTLGSIVRLSDAHTSLKHERYSPSYIGSGPMKI